jgi:hypothetical protein
MTFFKGLSVALVSFISVAAFATEVEGPRNTLKAVIEAAEQGNEKNYVQYLDGDALLNWSSPAAMEQLASLVGSYRDLKFRKFSAGKAIQGGIEIRNYVIQVAGKAYDSNKQVPFLNADVSCDTSSDWGINKAETCRVLSLEAI